MDVGPIIPLVALVMNAQATDAVFQVPNAPPAAMAWRVQRDTLWLASQLVALTLPALLLITGWASTLRTFLDRLARGRRLLTAALFAGVYAALAVVVQLPVSAARQALAGPLGLGPPNWMPWAVGFFLDGLILVAVGFGLGWLPYLLFERSPRSWPVVAGALLIAFGATALLVQPLFSTIRPLSDPAVHATAYRLAAKAGTPDARIAVRLADRRKPCGGATVQGLGPTKILLIDTGLLRHHPPDEVAQTIAHELKHYAKGDDWRAFYVAVVLIIGGLLTLVLGARAALQAWSPRFGFGNLADPASLPLLVLLLTAFSLPASAAFRAYGASIERAADRFALDLTHDNAALASQMHRYLTCSQLLDPDVTWVQKTFRQSHPSFRERIQFARTYRPR